MIGSFTFFLVEWEDARKKRDLEFESLIPNHGDDDADAEDEQDIVDD